VSAKVRAACNSDFGVVVLGRLRAFPLRAIDVGCGVGAGILVLHGADGRNLESLESS
jgi:hypothetical protein